MCVCVCVDSGGPDLLDSKQLIHYSKPALCLPLPSPLSLVSRLSCCQNSSEKQRNLAASELIDHWKRSHGKRDACLWNASCVRVVSFVLGLSSEVFPPLAPAQSAPSVRHRLSHFTVNWISWTLISLCCNWVCWWDVFPTALHQLIQLTSCPYKTTL